MVFIQNTYFDGITASDYTGTSMNTQSQSISGNFPLDRFSFMVKRSLAKIDPKLVSGSGFDMNGALESFSEKVLGFSGSLAGITSDIFSLKSSLDILSARITVLETLSARITVLETLQSTHTDTPVLTGLSPADRAILDSIDYVNGVLIPKVAVLFQKVVTFANDVVFQSRVIFSDPDMAGQMSIQPGQTEVTVTFDRPYPGVPVITLTPVGHFNMGVVTDASKR